MNFFKDKHVLVTGGTGLIGKPLVDRLASMGAKVTVVSLDTKPELPEGVVFKRIDLREFSNCLDVCDSKEIVFNLVGVKGSPAMTSQRPASFMVPTLQFSVNMMEAARQQGVKRYLFTSSVGVYSPAEVFFEDDVWKTFPSDNDRHAGWAKRICELQAHAYQVEHGWDKISIVRPANVYGPHDNFDPANAMVIPSLIRRVIDGENPLTVWGNGSAIRDFIYSDDVARGMLHVVEHGINLPVNLGSGDGVTIKTIAEIVCSCAPDTVPEILWDESKPGGDARRLMDTSRARALGFETLTPLRKGIADTVKWFLSNRDGLGARYNPFTEEVYLPSSQKKS